MAWQVFKFIVWFCKWRSAKNLKIAEEHYRRSRWWTDILKGVAERIVARQAESK